MRAFPLLLAARCQPVRGSNGDNLLQGGGEFPLAVASFRVKRSHGSGHLYVKHGSYYGRWRGADGRFVNKKIGKVRTRGAKDGITRAEAERGLRRLVEPRQGGRRQRPKNRPVTVDQVADELRERLAVEGARLSYRQNCESMQRIHVSPALGKRRIETVTRQDVERLARSMLARGLAPKAVRKRDDLSARSLRPGAGERLLARLKLLVAHITGACESPRAGCRNPRTR